MEAPEVATTFLDQKDFDQRSIELMPNVLSDQLSRRVSSKSPPHAKTFLTQSGCPSDIIALDEPNEANMAIPPCPPCEKANRLFLDYADRLGFNFLIGDEDGVID